MRRLCSKGIARRAGRRSRSCEPRQDASARRHGGVGQGRRREDHVPVARQRKRLGVLTKEQEAAIEALLMSTVNKISHPIISQMRRFYETGEPDAADLSKDSAGLEE